MNTKDVERLRKAIVRTTDVELKSNEMEALIRDSKPVYTATYGVYMKLAQLEFDETIGFLEEYRVKCSELKKEKVEWEKDKLRWEKERLDFLAKERDWEKEKLELQREITILMKPQWAATQPEENRVNVRGLKRKITEEMLNMADGKHHKPAVEKKFPNNTQELKEFLDTTLVVEDISEEIEWMQTMLGFCEAEPFILDAGSNELAKLRTRLALAEDLRKSRKKSTGNSTEEERSEIEEQHGHSEIESRPVPNPEWLRYLREAQERESEEKRKQQDDIRREYEKIKMKNRNALQAKRIAQERQREGIHRQQEEDECQVIHQAEAEHIGQEKQREDIRREEMEDERQEEERGVIHQAEAECIAQEKQREDIRREEMEDKRQEEERGVINRAEAECIAQEKQREDIRMEEMEEKTAEVERIEQEKQHEDIRREEMEDERQEEERGVINRAEAECIAQEKQREDIRREEMEEKTAEVERIEQEKQHEDIRREEMEDELQEEERGVIHRAEAERIAQEKQREDIRLREFLRDEGIRRMQEEDERMAQEKQRQEEEREVIYRAESERIAQEKQCEDIRREEMEEKRQAINQALAIRQAIHEAEAQRIAQETMWHQRDEGIRRMQEEEKRQAINQAEAERVADALEKHRQVIHGAEAQRNSQQERPKKMSRSEMILALAQEDMRRRLRVDEAALRTPSPLRRKLKKPEEERSDFEQQESHYEVEEIVAERSEIYSSLKGKKKTAVRRELGAFNYAKHSGSWGENAEHS